MPRHPKTDRFLLQIQRKLNLHRSLTAFWWVLGVGSVLMLCIALVYILQGHAVPGFWYPTVLGATALVGLVVLFFRRLSREEASDYADEVFGLHDTVTSSRSFSREGKDGGFYALQARATDKAIERVDTKSLRYRFPVLLAGAALLLAGVAGLTAFSPPSDAVLKQLAEEEATLQQTEEFAEEIEEAIQELGKEPMTEEERELLDVDKLRQWAKEVKSTRDRKDAMRQLARLQKRIDMAANRLGRKQDEQLLARAGSELEKGRQTRGLGEKLKQGRYKDAAKELEKLKFKKETKRKMTPRKKKLAKLKAAAQRMAGAARSRKSFQGESSKGAQSKGELSSKLGRLMELLEKHALEFEGELSQAELAELENQLSDEDIERLERMAEQLNKMLEQMQGNLKGLSARKKIRGKLGLLGKKLGQGQGKLAGLIPLKVPGAGTGGREAGVGTVESRREGEDPLKDNEQYTQIKGIKGVGPSQKQTEAASDGSGVAQRKVVERNRAFERQVESFVSREDVPEDVKLGVKKYFTRIHEATGDESESE